MEVRQRIHSENRISREKRSCHKQQSGWGWGGGEAAAIHAISNQMHLCDLLISTSDYRTVQYEASANLRHHVHEHQAHASACPVHHSSLHVSMAIDNVPHRKACSSVFTLGSVAAWDRAVSVGGAVSSYKRTEIRCNCVVRTARAWHVAVGIRTKRRQARNGIIKVKVFSFTRGPATTVKPACGARARTRAPPGARTRSPSTRTAEN